MLEEFERIHIFILNILRAPSDRHYVQHTSAAYLELLATFSSLWQKKENELLQQKERYVAGLNKLHYAASQVTVMQEELRRLQPQLIDTSTETESLMVKIEQDTIEVEAQKEVNKTSFKVIICSVKNVSLCSTDHRCRWSAG